MPSCYQCSVSYDDNVLTCVICSLSIHHKCLYVASCIPEKWHNNNTPSKAVLQLLNCPNFSFTCTSCITTCNSNSSSNDTPSPSPPVSTPTVTSPSIPSTLPTPSLKYIADGIDEFKNMLSKNSFTSYTDKLKISTDKIITSNTSINKKLNNLQSFTDLKSLAVVIEQLLSSEYNTNFINTLCTFLECDSQSISKVIFNYNRATIFFSNKFAKSLFLSNKTIKDSCYNSIFIRNYVNLETVRRGKMLYHATKANLISNCKSVFNHKSSDYELRQLLPNSNSVNWKGDSLKISISDFESWSSSFKSYVNNINAYTSKTTNISNTQTK